jgi:hypothetical protein
MFPDASKFPVGSIELPPEIVKVPLVAVRDPAPVYVVLGEIVIDAPETGFPMFTVEVFEVTETAPAVEVMEPDVVTDAP